jgi:hypothetical protein
MRANGSKQHLVPIGAQGVLDIAWGTAPLVPPGSPGTLSQAPPAAHRSVASRAVRCPESPAWPASTRCSIQRRWRL